MSANYTRCMDSFPLAYNSGGGQVVRCVAHRREIQLESVELRRVVTKSPEVPADGIEWCGDFFDLFFSAVTESARAHSYFLS